MIKPKSPDIKIKDKSLSSAEILSGAWGKKIKDEEKIERWNNGKSVTILIYKKKPQQLIIVTSKSDLRIVILSCQ